MGNEEWKLIGYVAEKLIDISKDLFNQKKIRDEHKKRALVHKHLNTEYPLSVSIYSNGSRMLEFRDFNSNTVDLKKGMHFVIESDWNLSIVRSRLREMLRPLKPVPINDYEGFKIYLDEYDHNDLVRRIDDISDEDIFNPFGFDLDFLYIQIEERI